MYARPASCLLLSSVPRMSLTPHPVHLLCHLLLLLTALGIGVGAHSLCFDFAIKSWSRPGQPWCKAQVFMNKNLFLQYNSDSNMVKPVGLLGKKVLPLCRPRCFVSVKQNDALVRPGSLSLVERNPSSLMR
ncbi:retinoic acid early transcript 1E-like [Callithrix jacchus]|uniref:retinoic acid early transcript 1E-like n=1 Tax=Callithrix jacchus TaxID=9483 RepID=UPI0012345B3C|nr:retinoic acid early transcript 1E-like [Callithrix jacchus]